VEAKFRIEEMPGRLADITLAIYDPFNVEIRSIDMSERKCEQLLQLIEEIKTHNGGTMRTKDELEQPNAYSRSGG
jgi:hypothetical protein